MTTVNDKQNHTSKLEKDFNKNMARLQQYLSTDGKELKYETQLRAFFVLPYIEDPLSDPLFREILNKSWIEKLSIHLQEFIAKYVQVNNINLWCIYSIQNKTTKIYIIKIYINKIYLIIYRIVESIKKLWVIALNQVRYLRLI